MGIIFHFLFNLWVGKLNTKKLFFKSNDLKIYFIYKSRIIFHYALGIEYRLNELEKSYLLDKIIFNDGDIFIDCGSNIGEVSLYLFRRNPKLKGFLFEIEKPEIEASKKNLKAYDAIHYNVALSDKDGKIKYYSKPSSADTSIIKIIDGDEEIIESIKLDSFFKNNSISKCKFLKLEAEGAEIEVLNGGLDYSLKRIQYVSIDSGPERGINQESTLSQTNEIMVKNGFNLIFSSKLRDVNLYKNIRD